MPANAAELKSYCRLLRRLLLALPDTSHRKFARPLPIDCPRRHSANTFNVDFRWAHASRIQMASTACTARQINRICMYTYVCTQTDPHTRARTHTLTYNGQCAKDRKQNDCMAISHAAYAYGNATLQTNDLNSNLSPLSPHSPLSLPCLQTKNHLLIQKRQKRGRRCCRFPSHRRGILRPTRPCLTFAALVCWSSSVLRCAWHCAWRWGWRWAFQLRVMRRGRGRVRDV